ncbi:unnamed protein product, partial [Oppiella nova]
MTRYDDNHNTRPNRADIESGSHGKPVKSDSGFRLKFWKKKKPKTDGQTNVDLKDVRITEHLIDVHEVCERLHTHPENGITEKEAAFRLQRDGPNAFTPPKQTAWWILYLREMTGGFALLLWFASIASFVAFGIENEPQDMYLGIVLALTVILTGSFSYYQAASSSKVFKSFKNMTPP